LHYNLISLHLQQSISQLNQLTKNKNVMSLSEEASKRVSKKLPDVGIQPARCYAIIDLGTQPGSFKGQPTDPSLQIMFLWELTKFMNVPEDKTKKPWPCTIKQQYAFSAGAKAKFPDVLKAWGKLSKRPEKIGVQLLKNYLGAPCMITVEHSEDGQWANVGSKGRGVSPFMKENFAVPELHNKPIFFNMDEFSWDKFKELPEFVQKIVRNSLEFPSIASKNPEPVSQSTGVVDQGISNATQDIHVDSDAPQF
jgi:hypothetical protein